MSAYITTNVISITDGQIFLSIDLFLSGIKPSVDVGLSVTRVGSSAQWPGMRLVSGSYKLDLAQYLELQAFSQFTSELGEETKPKLNQGKTLVELLKQRNNQPIKLVQQLKPLTISNLTFSRKKSNFKSVRLAKTFYQLHLMTNVKLTFKFL